MAFTGIMCTEANIDQKSGANSSASYTDTMKTQAVLEAENYVNVLTRTNFSDSFASLNVDVKNVLTEFVASLVAVEAITYDMSGYTTRQEAENMLSKLAWRIEKIEEMLKDEAKVETFISGA